jgi:hypothetical protein
VGNKLGKQTGDMKLRPEKKPKGTLFPVLPNKITSAVQI